MSVLCRLYFVCIHLLTYLKHRWYKYHWMWYKTYYPTQGTDIWYITYNTDTSHSPLITHPSDCFHCVWVTVLEKNLQTAVRHWHFSPRTILHKLETRWKASFPVCLPMTDILWAVGIYLLYWTHGKHKISSTAVIWYRQDG